MLPKLFSTKKCGLKLYLEKTPGEGGGQAGWKDRNEEISQLDGKK